MTSKCILTAMIILLLPVPLFAKDRPETSPRFSLLYSALHVASLVAGFHLAKNGGKVALTSYALQHASDTQKQKIEEEIIKDQMRNKGVIGIFSSTKLIEILKYPTTPVVSGAACATGVGMMLYGIQGIYRDIAYFFR